MLIVIFPLLNQTDREAARWAINALRKLTAEEAGEI